MASQDDLPTPSVVIDGDRLQANIVRLQRKCDAHRVGLWPHIKTHKLVPVARAQLTEGAKGLTCAKLGEAEAMLPSGVRRIFVAHSLVDLRQARRIAALTDRLDEFRTAVTSEAHLPALARLSLEVGRKLKVMMALDSGLHREGARNLSAAQQLAAAISRHHQLELAGFYTHEGHFYSMSPATRREDAIRLLDELSAVRDAIDPGLELWPGCSVTADTLVELGHGRIQAVRPGAYVFGDLSLTLGSRVMATTDLALTVLATVVDKPEPGLALIDAGSKTFSSDRTPEGVHGAVVDNRSLQVVRVNEEHGYVRGSDVDRLTVGERIAFVPAHVCTVVNLANEVVVVRGGRVESRWPVDARGLTQ